MRIVIYLLMLAGIAACNQGEIKPVTELKTEVNIQEDPESLGEPIYWYKTDHVYVFRFSVNFYWGQALNQESKYLVNLGKAKVYSYKELYEYHFDNPEGALKLAKYMDFLIFPSKPKLNYECPCAVANDHHLGVPWNWWIDEVAKNRFREPNHTYEETQQVLTGEYSLKKMWDESSDYPKPQAEESSEMNQVAESLNDHHWIIMKFDNSNRGAMQQPEDVVFQKAPAYALIYFSEIKPGQIDMTIVTQHTDFFQEPPPEEEED